jgi:hypothetical protein
MSTSEIMYGIGCAVLLALIVWILLPVPISGRWKMNKGPKETPKETPKEKPAEVRRVQPCYRGNDWCPVGCCSHFERKENDWPVE